MRSWRIVTIASAVWAMTALGTAAQAPDNRPGIAVLPFDVTEFPPVADLSTSGMNFGLQQMFLSELQANSELRVIDRREISTVMQELDLHGSGQVDAATASRIGQIVGARYMIGGNYWHESGPGTLRLDVRVIDGETTEVRATRRLVGDRERMFQMIAELASDLVEELDLPPLEGAVREARLSFRPPNEAIDLFSYAVGKDEDGEQDRALETLQLVVSRWPDYEDAKALRDELLNR